MVPHVNTYRAFTSTILNSRRRPGAHAAPPRPPPTQDLTHPSFAGGNARGREFPTGSHRAAPLPGTNLLSASAAAPGDPRRPVGPLPRHQAAQDRHPTHPHPQGIFPGPGHSSQRQPRIQPKLRSTPDITE
jgi:hypothetical protein